MTLQSERTTVKRMAERAAYDRDTVHAILDASYLCHVGFVIDGAPVVIPTLHARDGDHLLLHGSPASRLLRTARTQEICVTATLVDGFVLARSALHHSMNYRSVTVMGQAEVVPPEEKPAALDLLVEHLTPGRIPFLRPMLDSEVKATLVLRLPITEASAKVRTGPPGDDEEDYDLPIWAGVVPVTTHYGEPETDPAMRMEVEVPHHVRTFRADAAH
jgi:nitroimidazol reductase NimA-like FMN-containing flavoprotein (pyridoxamine 5'-phosphate oxidase superfamily)